MVTKCTMCIGPSRDAADRLRGTTFAVRADAVKRAAAVVSRCLSRFFLVSTRYFVRPCPLSTLLGSAIRKHGAPYPWMDGRRTRCPIAGIIGFPCSDERQNQQEPNTTMTEGAA